VTSPLSIAPPLVAAIYARKSNDQSLPDVEKSVTRQVEHGTAYASRKGWTVDPAHVYVDDAISGAEFVRRPGLAALMAALSPRPPFQVLVMAEPYRLGREAIETNYTLKRILDAGVAVWYYLDDKEARLDSAIAKVMTALSSFAGEAEREAARARTYDAMRRKAQAGHVAGGVVYGYDNVRVDGHVERRLHQAEAEVVRRIFRDYARGIGLRRLAATLTAERIPPPVPRKLRPGLGGWAPTALHAMLGHEIYRGRVVWGARRKVDVGGRTKVRKWRPEAERIRVDVPELRIVDEPLWQAVQARRRANAAARPSGWTQGTRPPALLAGLAKCAHCGAGLIRGHRNLGSARNRRRVPAYACGTHHRNRACANAVELLETTVDQAVLEALADALEPDVIEANVERAVAEEHRARAGSADRRQALERELGAIAARTARLTEAVAVGGAAVAPLLEKLGQEASRRAVLERERAELDALDGAADFASGAARRALLRQASRIREALLEHPAEARDVLRAFVPELRFTPFGAGRARGFSFEGTGDYGALVGTTDAHTGWCPRRDSNPCFQIENLGS
jgi:site-specific DNA recombinase